MIIKDVPSLLIKSFESFSKEKYQKKLSYEVEAFMTKIEEYELHGYFPRERDPDLSFSVKIPSWQEGVRDLLEGNHKHSVKDILDCCNLLKSDDYFVTELDLKNLENFQKFKLSHSEIISDLEELTSEKEEIMDLVVTKEQKQHFQVDRISEELEGEFEDNFLPSTLVNTNNHRIVFIEMMKRIESIKSRNIILGSTNSLDEKFKSIFSLKNDINIILGHSLEEVDVHLNLLKVDIEKRSKELGNLCQVIEEIIKAVELEKVFGEYPRILNELKTIQSKIDERKKHCVKSSELAFRSPVRQIFNVEEKNGLYSTLRRRIRKDEEKQMKISAHLLKVQEIDNEYNLKLGKVNEIALQNSVSTPSDQNIRKILYAALLRDLEMLSEDENEIIEKIIDLSGLNEIRFNIEFFVGGSGSSSHSSSSSSESHARTPSSLPGYKRLLSGLGHSIRGTLMNKPSNFFPKIHYVGMFKGNLPHRRCREYDRNRKLVYDGIFVKGVKLLEWLQRGHSLETEEEGGEVSNQAEEDESNYDLIMEGAKRLDDNYNIGMNGDLYEKYLRGEDRDSKVNILEWNVGISDDNNMYDIRSITKQFARQKKVLRHTSHPSLPIMVCSGKKIQESKACLAFMFLHFTNRSLREMMRMKKESNSGNNNLEVPVEKKSKKKKKNGIDVSEALRWVLGVAGALAKMKESNVIVFRICLDTIFIDENENPVLGSISCSRSTLLSKNTERSSSSVMGSILPQDQREGRVFLAPEVLRAQPNEEYAPTYEGMVYSLALVAFSLLSGQEDPYGGFPGGFEKNEKNISMNKCIPFVDLLEISEEYDWVKVLLRQCFRSDFKKRPSFVEFVQFFEEENRKEWNMFSFKRKKRKRKKSLFGKKT